MTYVIGTLCRKTNCFFRCNCQINPQSAYGCQLLRQGAYRCGGTGKTFPHRGKVARASETDEGAEGFYDPLAY
jgi:hypothetical protein